MILIYKTFASFFLLVFLLSLNIRGQELPGTSLPGAATTVSSQDKADKTELDNYLPLAGGTMTGQLNINNKRFWYFER